jgi:hypothetical protein
MATTPSPARCGPPRPVSSRIEGRRSGGVNNGVYLNAFHLLQPGFGALIAHDLGPAMREVNASAFIRIPFAVADAGNRSRP